MGSTRLVTGVGTQIANAGFEQGLTGWAIGGSTGQLITDPTRAHSGSNYVQLSTPANASVDIQNGLVAVNPGDQVAFGGWAYLESGSAPALGWWLAVYDGNHNPVTYVGSLPGPSSGWTYESGTYTVPSNGAYVLLYASIYQPSATTVLRVDDGFLAIGRTATTVDNLDYLPFGEQIAGDTGTTHKFTGQERDAETGLDYFVARYFSGAQGRFFSPDPFNAGSVPTNPQSWNMYSYVLNNPLIFVDPTGYDCAYLNDPGNAIAGVDTNTNLNDCTANGGYWLSGSINPNMLTIYSDGTYGFFDAAGNAYDNPTTLNNYIYGPQPPSDFTAESSAYGQLLEADAGIAQAIGSFDDRYFSPISSFIMKNLFINEMVKTDAPWDFKNQPTHGANNPQLDDFGNCHFGVVTHAVGLPDWYARWAAGLASWWGRRETPSSWGRPWSSIGGGDFPLNQIQITRGQVTGRCTP